MARARRPRRGPALDATDPDGLVAWSRRYLEHLQAKNYSEYTLVGRRRALQVFLVWCQERALTKPTQLTRPVLERYQRFLFLYRRRASGKPLSVSTQRERLTALKVFFRWLTKSHVLLSNPASDLDLPRASQRLPKEILTAEEAEKILAGPDTATPLGLRDRAMLEVLYSTGLRRTELSRLDVYDLLPSRGVLVIREGKGRKDRVVPVGQRALHWCGRYLDEVRPHLVYGDDPGALFVSNEGTPLPAERLTQLMRGYVDAAKLGKKGACHIFRHTMATLMLENGADIRYIQEMLGHAKLTTTEIYTRVSVLKLKEIHTATHPTARMETPESPEESEE